MFGIFLNGICVDARERKREFDGKVTVNYSYLVMIDGDAFKVTSDNDYRNDVKFGDEVTFKVRIRAYNGTIYYNGDLIDEEDN